jgi:hypothetical protein
MSNKLEIEKYIFSLVYNKKTELKIEHEDKPDFWICNSSNQRFGVEITEIYKNESDARLTNIPNYTGELLDFKKYRHKDDFESLIVDDIEIISEDGDKRKTKAVVQSVPSITEFSRRLSNCIHSKNNLSFGYNKELSYYNLIVYDRINSLSVVSIDDFFNVFFTKEIIHQLTNTNFKEIFLITSLSNKKFYFPLKRILFVSRIYLFQELIQKIYKEGTEISDKIYYRWLAEFLECEGFKDVYLFTRNGNFELNYANIGFALAPNNQVQIRLYDTHILDYSNYEKITNRKYYTPENENMIEDIKQTFGFSCGLGVEIKNNNNT